MLGRQEAAVTQSATSAGRGAQERLRHCTLGHWTKLFFAKVDIFSAVMINHNLQKKKTIDLSE